MPADLATVQRLHPGWNVTQIAYAPNGGIWAVGRDGGVFSLNSEGGTAGEVAPFYGSYTGLAPEGRQGTRDFTGIRATGTGYELLSNRSEVYAFNMPTAPIQQQQGGGDKPGVTSPPPGDNTSGRDVFIGSLIAMGFTRERADSLGGNLWNNSKTKSEDALYFDLVGSAEYQARFPGMKALREKGTVINEAQYIGLERQYESIAESAGLPAEFRERDDFGQLIARGVSPNEWADRVRWGQTAALSDPILLDEIARQNGNPIGDATAFYLNPERGTQVLEDQRIKAETGAAARRSGFGQLSQTEIDSLWARGITPNQAAERFDLLGAQSGLIANTAGETMTDDQFTRSDQLATVTDPTGQATQKLETRRRRRQAQFQGGGGATSGGGGKTGLG